MTSAFDTGTYNVEATLTAWVAVAIATYPAALASGAKLVLNEPEEPLTAPMYAVEFMGTTEEATYQGRTVGSSENGEMLYGMFRVAIYVSRAAANWRAQVAQMSDAVRKAYKKQASGAVIIKDFYTNANMPTDTAQRLTLVSLDKTTLPLSLNPDIEGAAIYITYQYVERA